MKRKTVIGVFLLACVSIIVYLNFRQYAFPEHSVQFQIDQHKAGQNTIQLAQKSGMDTTEVRKATIFQIDEQPKTYLEREIGAKRTGELAKKDVDLWYFTTRLFKPLQKEEFYASYAPDGRLVSFAHEIEETQAGERLTKENAELIAREYLSQNCAICIRTGFPENWQFVQYSKVDRPNRLDHQFLYERKEYSLKDARQRVSIVIAGDKVTEFDEFVKVPQSWVSSYNKEKSYNNIAQIIAEFFSTLCITFPMILIFFKKYKERKLSFKIAYITAIVMSAVTVFELLNNFPQYYYSYPNTQTNTIVVILGIFALFVTWIITFITAEITLATTESYYREVFPFKKNTTQLVKNFLITPFTLNGIWIGASIGIMCFVYELAYYFLGKQLGFWVPADINYSDAFNSAAPWLYPLSIGLLPAINEEVIYRLFAIPLFKKFIGSRITNQRIALGIAVVIASLAWSFQHSAYPQTPFFVRGIEILFIGIVFSYLFLRYGILASISAHYSFNALQMAIFFIDSKSTVNVILAFAVALLPFWIFIIGSIVQKITKKQKNLEDIADNQHSDFQSDAVSNPKVDKSKLLPRLETAGPLSGKLKLGLIAIAVFALVLTAISTHPPSEESGGQGQFTNRAAAISAARQFLTSKNTNLSGYMTVATIITSGDEESALTYIKNRASEKEVQQFINNNKEPPILWMVRFFKPLQKEEYKVYLKPNGTVYTHLHILNEKASGAKLTEEEALRRAMSYLSERISDPWQFSNIDNQSFKRDNRTDYQYIFEDRRKIGEASRRIAIDIIDGDPQNLQSTIKLPENYERQNEQISPKQLVLIIVGTIVGFLVIGFFTTTIFSLYKEKKLFLKPGVIIGIIAIIFGLISQINNATVFYAGYSTDLQLWVYAVFQLIEIPIYIILTLMLIIICINGGTALYQQYIGDLLPSKIIEQKKLLGTALFLVIVISLIGVCILYLSQNLSEKIYPGAISSASSSSPDTTVAQEFQTFIPALEGLKFLTRSFIVLFAFITTLCVVRKYCRSWKNVGYLVVGLSLLAFFATDWKTPDLLAGAISYAPVILYTFIAWKYFVRNNIFFYLLTIFYIQIGNAAITFLTQNDAYLKMNGFGFLCISALPWVIWLLYDKIFRKLDHVPSSTL